MITWFIAVAVVATLAGVVALATGLGGTLAVLERSVPQVLPAGEITPRQLHGVRFPAVVAGYHPEAVDALLDRVAEQWQARLDAAAPVAEPVAEPASSPAVEGTAELAAEPSAEPGHGSTGDR